MPRTVLCRCEDHTQRCTAIGNDIHDRDGIELHGQDLHGDLAEFFRFLIHDVVAQAIRLIDFQRGQPLQILQKGIAELCVLPPIARQELFAHVCTAAMATGISGTHTSSANAAGILTKHSTAKSVSGASMA